MSPELPIFNIRHMCPGDVQSDVGRLPILGLWRGKAST